MTSKRPINSKQIFFILTLPATLALLMVFGKPEINAQLAYQKPYIRNWFDFNVWGFSPLGENMRAVMAWGYWQTMLVAIAGRVLALLLSFTGIFIAWIVVWPGLSLTGSIKMNNSRTGYFWMNRFSEAFMTIPSLLLALSLGYVTGEGFYTMILVIGVSEWAFNQKWFLGRLNEYRRLAYVKAGEAIGAGRLHIFKNHLLPNILRDLLFLFFLYLPGSLLTVAGLEFLGLSSGSDISGLGSVIALNKDLIFLYPHVIVPPTLLIVLTVYVAVALKNKLRFEQGINGN